MGEVGMFAKHKPKNIMSQKHNRKSIRLKGYDYSSAGLYFITICTQNRLHQFGEIKNGEMILNENGKIVNHVWDDLRNRFENILLHSFVIMPNHIHGIVQIVGVGLCSTQNNGNFVNDGGQGRAVAPTVGDIICAFKSITTKLHNTLNDTPGFKLWQRNYFEHIIRTQKSYEIISNYIQSNPSKWSIDCMNIP
ncbi:MAG: transposase [Bacteroidales bacterium]|nr:transposase [Bacteroidales bacterium]